MAKMFYTAEETAQKLGKTVDGLKDLVRAGKLREFRDGGKAQYRVEDVDRLTAGGSRAGGTVAGRSLRLFAIDGGPLSNARIVEEITALLIGLNIRYKQPEGMGIRFTGLPAAR